MRERKVILNIDFLKIIYRKRKSIIVSFAIVIIISVLFSITLPEWYRSYTTILPPIEESQMTKFTSIISDNPLQALGLTGTQGEAEMYLATLNSRTIMEAAVRQFNLISRYKAKNMEEAIKNLRKHVGTHLDDEGTITFFAEAKTKWFSIFNRRNKDKARILSRDMANFFVNELDRMSKIFRSERARNIRIFIEKRYLQNIDDLHMAEEDLKNFEEEYGIIYLPQQTEATIDVASELKAQIISKELELEMARQVVGISNADYIKANKELKVLNKKFDEFKHQHPSISDEKSNDNLFIPFDIAPEIGIKYIRLFREVTLQEKLLEFLLPQYEQYKIQEERETSIIQVLDRAVKPVRKHRPKRSIMVLFFGFLSLLFSSMYFYFKPSIIRIYQDIKK